MTSAELYAELLVNIQQVTVFATLPSVANGSTNLDLSTDRRILSVLHDGIKATLELPCQVAEIDCPLPITGLKELSFRLPVAGESQARTDPGDREEQFTIWPASELSPETQLACQSCKRIIVKQSVSTWKDLPSEDWAEMMDFWHCHKPDIKGAAEVLSDASVKGYAASNTLEPSPGTAFVDTMHFRLASSDCTGIEVGSRATQLQVEEQTRICVSQGNKKEACLHTLLDQWHIRRYNCPRINPLRASSVEAR